MTIICCYFPVITVKGIKFILSFHVFVMCYKAMQTEKRGWRGFLLGETNSFWCCVYNLNLKFREFNNIFFFSGKPLILTEFVLSVLFDCLAQL